MSGLKKLIINLHFMEAVILFSHSTFAQSQIKPYIMILLDTSSSMLANPCGSGAGCQVWETKGDGSNDIITPAWGPAYPGVDSPNWDGDSEPNDSRLYIAKNAIRNVVNAYGDVIWGLMRYRAEENILGYGYSMNDVVLPAYNDNLGEVAGGASYTVDALSCLWYGICSPPFYSGTHYLDIISYLGFHEQDGSGRCLPLDADGGDVLVGFYEENHYEIIEWVDHHEQFNSSRTVILNHELRATGFTPLARAIQTAQHYMVPIRSADPLRDCRGYYLVIITDGEDTCEATSRRADAPPDAVQSLYSAGIKSFTIGFAFSSTVLDRMADIGKDGLENGDPASAMGAINEDELSAAFQQIIEDTIMVEVCDGLDNDCDTLVDEGFTLYCNLPAGHSAQDLCEDPGETVCDGEDDNCNGLIDEGLLNACGTCGPAPTEQCNGVDDDCDTIVDEGCPPGCPAQPEACNGVDDDCDGRVDEDITTSCGTNVGECTVGQMQCIEQSYPGDGIGHWTECSGVGPSPEVCDGVDNDCDGVVDGFSQRCEMAPGVGEVGECEYGYRMCIDGSWSECQGGVGPSPEVCDGLDNDCDGVVDDGNPGGGGSCGTDVGQCSSGVITCVGGMLICQGEIGPSPELCDGLDNDCDGVIDNGNPEGGDRCGPTDRCGVGICECGVMTCVTERPASASLQCVGSVYPQEEECNGLDDDCNGLVDDGLETATPCGSDIGECEMGVLDCVDGSWVCVGGVEATDEVCNGLDDDCDGFVDENNPGGGVLCGDSEGECQQGITWCSNSDTPPPCEPPEPLPEPPTLLCLCAIGPSPEVCDGLDNDCNGAVDDGLGIGQECGETTGECRPGHYECIDGELVCTGGIGPQPEVCDCRDNNCNGEVDEDNPCEGGDVCYQESAGVCYCTRRCDIEAEWPCPEGMVCDLCPELGEDVYCCKNDPCREVQCKEGETCRGGQCLPICDVIVCPEGQVCKLEDRRPRCVPADCYSGIEEYMCEEGEICKGGECVPDPCYGVVCEGENEFCRDGECYKSCSASIINGCPDCYFCYDGQCIEDKCCAVDCPEGMICEPEAALCVDNPCQGIRCRSPLVCIDGKCVDPPCSYINCPEGYECMDGSCYEEGSLPELDRRQPDGWVGADGKENVMASGGGGCAGCFISGGKAAGDGEGGGWIGILIIVVITMLIGQDKRKENR